MSEHAASKPDGDSRSLPARNPALMLLKVAWLSVLLGLTMHLLTACATKLSGGTFGTMAQNVQGAAQKISWSSLVCLGVALGSAVSKARAAFTGLAGFFAAPVGFIGARTVNKSVSAAVGGAPPAAMSSTLFWTLIGLKAAQYALFGILLHYVSRRRNSLSAYILVGLGCGAVFGITAMVLTHMNAAEPPPTPQWVGQAINEVFFPVGCALVLYVAECLAPKLKDHS